MKGNLFKFLLLAFVVIVIIILFYLIVIHNRDQYRREKAVKCLENSNGTFDESARLALDELANIENPEPEDHFRRAEIRRYNVLEGDVAHARARNRDRAPAGLEDHRVAVGTIIRDYAGAIAGILDNVQRGRNIWGGNNNIDPELMLFQIIDLQNHLPREENDPTITQIIGFFDNFIVGHQVPQVRMDITRERVREAVQQAETRVEAVNSLFDNAVAYTNQMQNVHDSAVNSDLKETLEKLRKSYFSTKLTNGKSPVYINAKSSIEEAEEYLITDFLNADVSDPEIKSDAAQRTLNIIAEGEYISTYDENEDNIFALVWERCKHPNNAEKTNLMKEAVVLTLADCYEDGSPVCINGRCARMLGALTTLDYDVGVGSALTFEAYKNQIMEETKRIINETIEEGKKSSDEKFSKAALAYEKGDEYEDAFAEGQFKEALRKRIDENLTLYTTKIKPADLTTLRDTCHVYALIK